jgi:hypothetical protein
MNKAFVLKIESENVIVLISQNATQILSPNKKYEIVRNINSEPIKRQFDNIKKKCYIETTDTPDVGLMKCGGLFQIHSIVEFRHYGNEKPAMQYVDDSLEVCKGFTKFRPILSMILTNFRCRTIDGGKVMWDMEFEEM